MWAIRFRDRPRTTDFPTTAGAFQTTYAGGSRDAFVSKLPTVLPDHTRLTAPSTVPAGTPFSITITIQDAANETVTGDQGTVPFTASNGATADYPFTAADMGTHTFTMVPAAPDHLAFLHQPTDTLAGQTISPPVTVAVVDQFGTVEADDNTDVVTLSLGVNPGGGTLGGTLTLTVVNGVATFGDLSVNRPGVGYTLHATIGGSLPDVDSSPFTVM